MKQFFVLFLLTCETLFSQDSLSQEFMTLFNAYRTEKGLPALQYDMQLDSFGLERLRISSEGINDCFQRLDSFSICPDGRDQHFKFLRMAAQFNQSTESMKVRGENMTVVAEFPIYYDYAQRTFWEKTKKYIYRLLSIEYEKSKPIYSAGNRRILKNLPKVFLESWISSPKHNEFLLHKDITHIGFKVYHTTHYGLPYIHSVFLGGKHVYPLRTEAKK